MVTELGDRMPDETPQEQVAKWMHGVHDRLDKLHRHARHQTEVVDDFLRQDAPTDHLELAPAYGGPWVLEAVIVVTPTGTTSADLTLGDPQRKIPLRNVQNVLAPLRIPMGARDKVRLDFTPSAAGCYLHVMGRPVPESD